MTVRSTVPMPFTGTTDSIFLDRSTGLKTRRVNLFSADSTGAGVGGPGSRDSNEVDELLNRLLAAFDSWRQVQESTRVWSEIHVGETAPTVEETPTVNDLNMKWIENNPDDVLLHAGQWIAVFDQKIVGFGESVLDAVDEARSSGFDDPLLYAVPLPGVARF